MASLRWVSRWCSGLFGAAVISGCMTGSMNRPTAPNPGEITRVQITGRDIGQKGDIRSVVISGDNATRVAQILNSKGAHAPCFCLWTPRVEIVLTGDHGEYSRVVIDDDFKLWNDGNGRWDWYLDPSFEKLLLDLLRT